MSLIYPIHQMEDQLYENLRDKLMRERMRTEEYRPNPLETPSRYEQRKSVEAEGIITNFWKDFEQGIEYFIAQDRGFRVQALFDNLGVRDLSKRMELHNFVNESDYELLKGLLEEVYIEQDFARAHCMAQVMLILFPRETENYIIYGDILRQRDGSQAAAEFYDNVLRMTENPYFHYYAADCLIDAEQISAAIDHLQKALRLAESDPQYYDFAVHIKDELNRL